MEIHNLNKIPDGYEYGHSDLSELDEYDIEYVDKLGIDEAWYWYTTAPYEGSGQMVMRKGMLFDVHDMGHCSCFGPTEHISFKGKTWEDLLEYYSKEKYEQFDLLLEMVGKV